LNVRIAAGYDMIEKHSTTTQFALLRNAITVDVQMYIGEMDGRGERREGRGGG